MICQGGCKSIKEREENEYFIALDIVRNNNIHDALQEHIAGSVINDFHCDQCDKRVDITRKLFLNRLPNILILTLKRFVFNFDTFRNEKINTRVEFPHDLNLHKYHLDSQDAEAEVELS
jgi:ubiquitin carboxyl-terminal hydrolase 34